MKKIKQMLLHPFLAIGFLLRRISPLISDDRSYIKIDYFVNRGRWLNLEHPRRFNEKLQWLKINGFKEHHTLMVDKYECKRLVGEAIGEEYIIPTLGVWDNFDDINFACLLGCPVCRTKNALD